nr:hypothetical protein 6 [Paracoccaceae bacterium]
MQSCRPPFPIDEGPRPISYTQLVTHKFVKGYNDVGEGGGQIAKTYKLKTSTPNQLSPRLWKFT